MAFSRSNKVENLSIVTSANMLWLGGSGTRMVTVDNNGVVSADVIPAGGSGGGDVTSIETTSVDSQMIVFNGVTGKSVKKLSGTGFVKATSGVISFQAKVNMADLNTTGTPDGTKFLRDDGQWTVVSGGSGGTTYFSATDFTGSGTTSGDPIRLANGNGFTDPGSNGYLARTAANTVVARTLTGTTNRITITQTTGATGNPVFDVGTDIVTLTGTQTLTNKTLTSPTINGTIGSTGLTIAPTSGNDIILTLTGAGGDLRITHLATTTTKLLTVGTSGVVSSIDMDPVGNYIIVGGTSTSTSAVVFGTIPITDDRTGMVEFNTITMDYTNGRYFTVREYYSFVKKAGTLTMSTSSGGLYSNHNWPVGTPTRIITVDLTTAGFKYSGASPGSETIDWTIYVKVFYVIPGGA